MINEEAIDYLNQYRNAGNHIHREAMDIAIEALEIADRLENLDASHYISESRDWEYSYRSGFLNGYSQALTDIRGDTE